MITPANAGSDPSASPGTAGNLVEGNYIGVTPDGTHAVAQIQSAQVAYKVTITVNPAAPAGSLWRSKVQV